MFGIEAIQSISNIIRLPAAVHDIVSEQYSRKFQDAAGSKYSHYRDYIEKQPFERQRQLGLDAVERAIDKAESERRISPEVAEKLRGDMKNLERPELCSPTAMPPKINQMNLPSLDQLNQHVHDHNQGANHRLPEARSVSQWDGTTRSGTFLDIGDGRVAQHQGQGVYAVADVQRDLSGQQPPVGQYATLQQNGHVQVPQQTLALGLQLG